MTFTISTRSNNLQALMRYLGYKPIAVSPEGQLNCVRPMGADYPRFHAYVRPQGKGFEFNLHLDQKRPSYGEGSHMHSGEYEGEVVSDERARIETVIKELG